MNPYRAFHDANRLTKNGITSVVDSGTSNSVWICSRNSEEILAIKYFQDNDHGKLHYLAEKELLVKNQNCSFIPEIIDFDDNFKWVATKFAETNLKSVLTLKDVINVIRQNFQVLNVNYHAHESLPGILESTFNISRNSSILRILEMELEKTLWYQADLEYVRDSWQFESLIHGDVKLANIVLGQDAIKIFDWENVTSGRPEWDTVGLLQSVLFEALGAFKSTAWARQYLHDCIEEILSLDEFSRRAFVIRCVQSAFEFSAAADLIPKLAVNMIQIAEYVSMGDIARIREVTRYAS